MSTKTHAILSPSAAYRWLTCTPSARFEEQIPEEDNEFSREGTLAHDLAALILSSRAGVYKLGHPAYLAEMRALEADVAKFYASIDKPDAFSDMMGYAEDYANYVRSFIPMVGKSLLLVEQRLDMSEYAPLCFGTVDAAVITPKVLYVIDYKYGVGVRVSANWNKQMMLYGLGALLEAHRLGFDPDTVVVTIFQPRVSETPSTFEIDTADLLDWAEDELAPKAVLAIGGQGEFVAGSHCHFCKARTACKAYYDRFDDVRKIVDKRQMTEKDLQTVLTYGPTVATWVKKVIDETRAKMQHGKRIKGFKLVAGKGRRAFIKEADVVDVLLGEGFDFDQMYKAELRGITDLEGALGKKRFNQLFADNINVQEGNPQIVDEDDDRPAVGATAADDYDEPDTNSLL